MYGNTSSDRLGVLAKEPLIDLIHSRKVLHVSQEDVYFDHIFDVGTSSIKDGGEVLEALFLAPASEGRFSKPGSNKRGYTARSPTPPSTSFMVVGSMPTEPEQYTIPLHLMAWEKKGIGGGALSVLTASLRTILAA